MAFKNIQTEKIECFGWTNPYKDSWVMIAGRASTSGWKGVNKQEFEKKFADNVEVGYNNLMVATVRDLDTDIVYTLFFDNLKKRYDLKIAGEDNSNIQILPEEKKEFFSLPSFKATTWKIEDFIKRAVAMYQKVVKPHVEAGELMKVDETKLEAIESMADDKQLMRNVKNGLFVR